MRLVLKSAVGNFVAYLKLDIMYHILYLSFSGMLFLTIAFLCCTLWFIT